MVVNPKVVQFVMDQWVGMREARGHWEQNWQTIAEVMRPQRASFTDNHQPGQRRSDRVYESAPQLALRDLGSAIEGLMFPRTERWLGVRMDDADNDELSRDEMRWLHVVEDIMFDRVFYAPQSRWQFASASTNIALAGFGTGGMFIGENQRLDRIAFRPIPLKNLFVEENADGIIDTTAVLIPINARQAMQRFGRENLSYEVVKMSSDEKRCREIIPFVQLVYPRTDRRIGSPVSTNLPFASVTIDTKHEHVVKESGFHEFPFATPRWDVDSGDHYGRSPGWLALPDSLTANAVGRTLLRAGEMATDPPLFAPSEGVAGRVRLYPGGITYYKNEGLGNTGNRAPIYPLDTGKNLPVGREIQADLREQIFAAFFRNVLQLPTQGARMTATEILERKDEFLRTIGPVFGRLEADYTAVAVERVFAILSRSGAFPDAPDSLKGRKIKFKYASPIEKARRQVELAALGRTMEILDPLAKADPGVLDNLDADSILRDVADILDLPPDWLKDKTDVSQIREQRAQQEQAMAATKMAQQAAPALSAVAGAANAAAPADG